MEPWLYIVLLGAAISGYAWMMPKSAGKDQQGFVSEEAYNELLEDLEAENRELFDAVAKFKKEHDDKVDKLGRRIVDMELQMKQWTDRRPSEAPTASFPQASSPLSNSSPASEVPRSIDDHTNASSTIRETAETQQPADKGEERPATVLETEREEPPSTIRGRYSALLDMHGNGRSIEQIAKALSMNKGEVQLILQLARREEQQHA